MGAGLRVSQQSLLCEKAVIALRVFQERRQVVDMGVGEVNTRLVFDRLAAYSNIRVLYLKTTCLNSKSTRIGSQQSYFSAAGPWIDQAG